MMKIVNNVITPGTVVIVAGDFNVDLAGVDSIHNLTCLSKFINECGLTSCLAQYADVLNNTYRYIARNVFTKLDNKLISADNNYGFKVVNVDIVDDATNFNDHLLIKCALHLQDMNGSFNQARRQTCDSNNNSQYFRYMWSDTAKQQHYISTSNMLQLLTADFNSGNMCLSNYEFVNRHYNGIVGGLKIAVLYNIIIRVLYKNLVVIFASHIISMYYRNLANML